jgi:hypothetical protein
VTEPAVTLKGFFEQVRAGRLTAIRCGACGEIAIPPRELCPTCHAERWDVVPLQGTGTIVSFTIIRIPPRGRQGEAPYAIAVVKMEEGVSLLGRLVDVPLDAVKSGLAVRFRPLLFDDRTVIGFAPA